MLLLFQYFEINFIFFDNLISESYKIYEDSNLGKSCHCQGTDDNNRGLDNYVKELDKIIQKYKNSLSNESQKNDLPIFNDSFQTIDNNINIT